MTIATTTGDGYRQIRSRIDLALQRRQETRGVEFKRSLPWDELRVKLAKTAMAMSNNRDGGIIIIGVAENDEWELTGVGEPVVSSYDQDDVASFFAKFSSPTVAVETVRHLYDGNEFVVLIISPFRETPVIVKRDSPDNGTTFRRGDFLVRPHGKAETVRASDESQINEALEVAAEKRARRFLKTAEQLGLQVPESAGQEFDTQLNSLVDHGLDFSNVPTWEFNIRGLAFDENRIPSLSKCREIIERSSVAIRGWDFPTLDRTPTDLFTGQNSIAVAIEFMCREFWQFWTSGQFLFIEGIREEVDTNWKQKILSSQPLQNVAVPPDARVIRGHITLISNLYRFVELFEFAARLTECGIYDEGLKLSIRLRNAKGYMLTTDWNRRLRYAYTVSSDNVSITEEYSPEQIVAFSKANALSAYRKTLEQFFGWLGLPDNAFEEDVDEFLRQRRR
ncbi:MAG: ATP-binding protein [Pirellulales bacterium]